VLQSVGGTYYGGPLLSEGMGCTVEVLINCGHMTCSVFKSIVYVVLQ
jgi:hypothetical protein